MYGIGLDCGITSIGYSVVELNSDEEPLRIVRLGSRIFSAAENLKTGASLALPRREARGSRRRLRRHKHRNERIRNLLVDSGIITKEELTTLFDGVLEDVYVLRVDALDRKLSSKELARVLIHIAQRRGFKSNRKSSTSDKEDGKLLVAVSKNNLLMQQNGYRTAGEMFAKDMKFADTKRNKGENYSNTVSRDMVADEVRKIFEAQRSFLNSFAREEIEEKYLSILLSQRSFEEGPGGDSKYGGNQIEKMTGKCTLLPEQPRAVKASYSFQIFNLWQNINHMRILKAGESRALSDEERTLIFDAAHSSPSLNYDKIRKILNLQNNEFFAALSYGKQEVKKVESAKFEYLKPYHEIRKALDKVAKGRIKYFSKEQLNEIGRIFTVYKNDDTIEMALQDAGIDSVDISQLMTLGAFRKVGHISVEACDRLIPYLEKGMRYNEACEAAGFDFKGHKKKENLYLPGYAPEFENLTNPVVKRAVSQAIKVINAIIREQDESPTYINIELAREMSKSFEDRKSLEKKMNENRAKNDRAMERIRNEFGKINATGMDLIKLRLWEEQDGISPYSLKPIEISRLFEVGYVDVDHIVPYSISFDDSYSNKVLVLTEENRQKGNRLPMQYLKGEEKDKYTVWVNNNVRDFKKKQNLLKEKITDAGEFKERNLNDTKYLSRFLYNYINDNLMFAPSPKGRKKRVTAVNGAVTAYMRKRWGISKIREDGDLHHAADATVVACVTDGLIKKITAYSHRKELEYASDDNFETSVVVDRDLGEVIDSFPQPWIGFRKELEIRLSANPQNFLSEMVLPNYTPEQQEAVEPCFVSRMQTRKTKGAAHKDTVRSLRTVNEESVVVTKTALTSLKLKNGEIEGYYNPSSDRLLYEALKERLIRFNGDANAAFGGEEPFRKPTSDGKPGPVVKKVKIYERSSLNVPIHNGNGVAANDSMVRIDVFFVEGEGYYFVPIYIADTVKKELPKKAVIANKSFELWKEMDDKDFVFSLYPNDAVKITSKKPIKMTVNLENSTLPKEHLSKNEILYFVKAGISTASVTLRTHDNSYIINSAGLKTQTLIEKYEVDILGNCRKVLKEKRQKFGE